VVNAITKSGTNVAFEAAMDELNDVGEGL